VVRARCTVTRVAAGDRVLSSIDEPANESAGPGHRRRPRAA
jgi:hypothetical protein